MIRSENNITPRYPLFYRRPVNIINHCKNIPNDLLKLTTTIKTSH